MIDLTGLHSSWRTLWPLVVIWLCFGLYDLNNRLMNTPSPDVIATASAISSPDVLSYRLHEGLFEAYSVKLAAFAAEDATSVKLETASEVEIVSGGSKLDSLGLKIRLRGVFYNEESFAVFEGAGIGSDSGDLVKVKAGENLQGFIVESISTTEVVVVDSAGVPIMMRIFVSDDGNVKH